MEFDQLFVIRYGLSGELPRLENLRQQELYQAPCFRQARSPLPVVPLPR
jgi:hypothetical protein